MARILIHENRCQIKDEPDIGFLWALDQELSFKVQGAEHTKAYKLHVWDGRRKLLADNLNFPIGLRQRVTEFYKKHDKQVDIEDLREANSTGKPIDILTTLQKVNKIPYPYQLESVATAKEYDRGIIRIATGGGKTIISALITAEIGKNTAIYVIGKDLLHQIHDLYSSLFKEIKIGKVGDGICDIGNINIVSVWTVGEAIGIAENTDRDDEKKIEQEKYGQIRQMLKDCKVHIFDECHVAACATIQSICQEINPEHIYGMSASPWRDDGADLLIESILGRKIVDISASYLIERNYLVKPIIKFKKVPKYHEKLEKNYNTIYKNYIVENEVRNNLVTDNAIHLVNLGYQTLVLYQSINHGKILYDLISKKIPCVLLSGKDNTKVRQDAKDALENGKIKCIIASRIFDIGVDLPSLSGLVVAGSGKSSVRALQRIGRVIRKHPDKKLAAIIDFADDAAYLRKHAQERFKIYSIEEKFDVTWPN
jgi:superfamily II DNA or RNA helicase